MTKQVGDKVSVDGRVFVVVNVTEPGPATKAAAPDLVQTVVVQGARGACRLLNVFADGQILNAL